MKADISEIIEVCLLAGKIILSNGGETYRVEDTMIRIAQSYSVKEVYSFVTPTGIFLTVQGENKGQEQTKFIRIFERSIDLNKVVLVNDISRRICNGSLTIDEAYEKLLEIENQKHLYPKWIQIIAAAIATGFFALMFGGDWKDYLSAFITGGIGFVVFIYIHRLVRVKFFTEIITSTIIGLISVFFLKIGLGNHLEKIVVGSIMPMVPGVQITNAVRDLMAGDLVSGVARGSEALITALAIGTGIAVVISFL
ncbi:hypothetical protein BHF71_05250 [Vulcanibacillus modesticaldus]|uniref:Threonine/serine exporter-like N-terminal domain-containing protein n=1 Tax=Vulcanibacillus modesticaldus TaxID=337097 RepID=A0A1D2YXC3_9BACI|nr:threonine/serine exporter family protein [Vulcanibacillus modesticaldus]OEG00308.1 hypothetical protein BHF71_05250 [Vulcanibacillus modesticaldus]